MGNKKAIFAVSTTALTAFGTFVACGSDKAKPDAAVVHDSPVQHDAPADAAPDASPYDFTCYGGSAAGSAAATITVAGTTEAFGQGGATPVGSAAVEIYKSGSANPVDAVTSGSDGTFTSGNITTGGTPFAGYIKAKQTSTYRVSYLYPPNPIAASIAGLPIPMIAQQTFGLFGGSQNDTTNGAMLLTVTDCNNMPISGATLHVKQNNAEVGSQFDLGSLVSQAKGITIVTNVPDGATEVSADFGSMTFPVHTVAAHKQESVPNGSGAGSAEIGTLTLTTVRPGP